MLPGGAKTIEMIWAATKVHVEGVCCGWLAVDVETFPFPAHDLRASQTE